MTGRPAQGSRGGPRRADETCRNGWQGCSRSTCTSAALYLDVDIFVSDWPVAAPWRTASSAGPAPGGTPGWGLPVMRCGILLNFGQAEKKEKEEQNGGEEAGERRQQKERRDGEVAFVISGAWREEKGKGGNMQRKSQRSSEDLDAREKWTGCAPASPVCTLHVDEACRRSMCPCSWDEQCHV